MRSWLKPSTGSSVATSTPASRATVSADLVRDERLGEHRGRTGSADLLDEVLELTRAGLGFGERPASETSVSPYSAASRPNAACVVTITRALAPPETTLVHGVDRPRRVDQPVGVPPDIQVARPIRSYSERETHRVEPDVRIDLPVEDVERRSVALLDRFLDRGLEASSDVHDQLGIANRLDVARRELDIVGLCAGRCEVDDLERVPCDLRGRPCERVERRDDRAP